MRQLALLLSFAVALGATGSLQAQTNARRLHPRSQPIAPVREDREEREDKRPAPRPEPKPAPRPVVPRPTPRPEPKPAPRPVVPRPTPRPEPKPAPRPVLPRPTPRPEPKPAPRPALPRPTPRPEPKPAPRPVLPRPTPRPEPKPAPRPVLPRPTPRPEPKPAPRPDYRPDHRPDHRHDHRPGAYVPPPPPSGHRHHHRTFPHRHPSTRFALFWYTPPASAPYYAVTDYNIYECRNCHKVSYSPVVPGVEVCGALPGYSHAYQLLGRYGQLAFTCTTCGVTINSDGVPNIGHCGGLYHSWTQLVTY